jgi:hypothetical protein
MKNGRNLICGHKLHIGTPYCGKRFWTHQIPTSSLPTLLIFIHIEHICSFFVAFFSATTKYQISAINSYWAKCDEKYLGRTEGQMEGRKDRRTEVKQYTPSPSGEQGYIWTSTITNIRIHKAFLLLVTSSFFLGAIHKKHNYTPAPRRGRGYTVLPLSICPSFRQSFRPSKIFFIAFFSVTVDGRNLMLLRKIWQKMCIYVQCV